MRMVAQMMAHELLRQAATIIGSNWSSGAKGRDQRPGLDAMMKDIKRMRRCPIGGHPYGPTLSTRCSREAR
jgi:hypothetical protein